MTGAELRAAITSLDEWLRVMLLAAEDAAELATLVRTILIVSGIKPNTDAAAISRQTVLAQLLLDAAGADNTAAWMVVRRPAPGGAADRGYAASALQSEAEQRRAAEAAARGALRRPRRTG